MILSAKNTCGISYQYMKHCRGLLDHYRHKAPTNVKTEVLPSSNLKKKIPPQSVSKHWKFKDFSQDLHDARQLSTALIRDNCLLSSESEFMENQFDSKNFRLLCIKQKLPFLTRDFVNSDFNPFLRREKSPINEDVGQQRLLFPSQMLRKLYFHLFAPVFATVLPLISYFIWDD